MPFLHPRAYWSGPASEAFAPPLQRGLLSRAPPPVYWRPRSPERQKTLLRSHFDTHPLPIYGFAKSNQSVQVKFLWTNAVFSSALKLLSFPEFSADRAQIFRTPPARCWLPGVRISRSRTRSFRSGAARSVKKQRKMRQKKIENSTFKSLSRQKFSCDWADISRVAPSGSPLSPRSNFRERALASFGATRG